MGVEIENLKINWFPGHMKKTNEKIKEKLSLVDFVIFVLDARAIRSTFNSYLLNLAKNKEKLFILNKSDLADEIETNKWEKQLIFKGNDVISLNLKNNNSRKILFKEINKFILRKKEKMNAKGIKNCICRAIILGIPNVGKSTLINVLLNRNQMKAENHPGLTKKITWAKVNDNFELLDTPGVLEANYENNIQAIHLSLIGSIKQEILPIDKLVEYLIGFLKDNYLDELNKRYEIKVKKNTDLLTILKLIAEKRGFLKKGNELDIEKSKILLLNEFKNGKICRFSLDKL